MLNDQARSEAAPAVATTKSCSTWPPETPIASSRSPFSALSGIPAREGGQSAFCVFEAVRLGVGLAYVPYRLRFSHEQDRSPVLSERDIGGSKPSSVHSRKGLHVTRRIEDRDTHGDSGGLRFRSGAGD
jgi:hypothetical protein